MKKVAVIIDDHVLFTDSFSLLLEKTKFFDDIYILNNNYSKLDYYIKNYRIELYVFLDYYLKKNLGIHLLKEIKLVNKNAKIIVVSSVSQPAAIHSIMLYQPDGFISKFSGYDSLLNCLDALKNGKEFYCPVISEVINTYNSYTDQILTEREIEVLNYFSKGFTIEETAKKLVLSKHTIVAHRRNMLKKTKMKSIIELLAYARSNGLIS